MENKYTVNEIKAIIKESLQEFEPKKGNGVTDTEKKINADAYKDAKKRGQNFDGGLGKTKQGENKIERYDDNKTTLDYTFDYEPSKEYKERVKAQVKGHTSTMEEDNDLEGDADFKGNEKYYDYAKENAKLAADLNIIGKKAGIRGQNIPDEAFIKDTMFENKKNMKTLNFKKTQFMNENHMLSLIPEDYKKDGQCFIMKDSAANEYVIECKANEKTNVCETNVIKYENKVKIDEKFSRMKDLFNYKSSNYFKTSDANFRKSENEQVGKLMENIRKMSVIE